jgi:hypothetical protein
MSLFRALFLSYFVVKIQAAPGYSDLFRPIPAYSDPPPGGVHGCVGNRCRLITVICAYLQLLTPINAFFPEKKDGIIPFTYV